MHALLPGMYERKGSICKVNPLRRMNVHKVWDFSFRDLMIRRIRSGRQLWHGRPRRIMMLAFIADVRSELKEFSEGWAIEEA